MPHPLTLTSPLPAGDLLLQSLSYTDTISDLDKMMHLELLSEKADIDADALLGQPVNVTMRLRDDLTRHFHGYVSRFRTRPHQGRHFCYEAVVQPWLWFLTRTYDCRIFQDKTVPEIVAEVFADHSIANFQFKLFRSYRKWTYCVQYRESDYDFIARLLEHEGIYWYFVHSDGQHQLVLVDSQSAHDPSPQCPQLPYYGGSAGAPPYLEHVSSWDFSRQVKPGKAVLTSYDFERPSTDLRVNVAEQRKYGLGDYEVFDFQGDYAQSGDGTQWVENRLDEAHAREHVLHATTNAQGLQVGHLLDLQRHPREDQNAKYLITRVDLNASVDAHESAGRGQTYSCGFTAIPATQQFRPRRRITKPTIKGPQTAVVVGPAGEEIYTDKYGRVKVQFHWDRYGQNDDKSSCWVRVSHPWAGKNFGIIEIPRIGQEVVVAFLEGDPDQPLITGRVYNAEQMPPWPLPANATQSGILTRSSKGGGYGNANAIRFEDKAGSEQLWIHAEKNQDIEVENDETHSVGHDRTKTVDHDETTHVKHDRTETVDNNETITIGVNRTEKVGADEKITIGANRTENVVANETIGIGGNRSITVSGSETATVTLQRTHLVGVNETIGIGGAQEIGVGLAQIVGVGGLQSITVGANQSTKVVGMQSNSVGLNQSTDVGGNQSTKVTKNRSLAVSGAQTTQVTKARTTSVGEDDKLTVGKNLVVTATESITLTTGKASITMKKDGTIAINGKDISAIGSGKINVKADKNLVMKALKILEN